MATRKPPCAPSWPLLASHRKRCGPLRAGCVSPCHPATANMSSRALPRPADGWNYTARLWHSTARGALPEPSRQRRPLPEGYDLLLTTAKWPQYCHSQQRDLPSLRRRMPEPLVELHPETARRHGITAGEWIEIHTALGSVRARARLEPHLAENVVCAQYGWWQYADGAGDTNRILDGECFDPVSGSNALRSTPCYLRLWPGDDDRDEGSQRTG